MLDETIETTKAGLRIKALAARAAVRATERTTASKAAADHFFHAFSLPAGAMIAGYWPIRDELDCRPVLTRLVDAGQPVCLPVVSGDDLPLELRLWEDGAALYPAGFGTLAPAETAPRCAPDYVLMPLLGFDAQGTRLGYGGGHYDRTLAALTRKPVLVGFAFASQEIDTIPRGDHDVPLDAVVTELGVRHFGTGPRT
jgi:5-formyltetrahydrofolate cyclo-ligase